MFTNDYIAQKLYEERSARLSADVAAHRLARPVRRPRSRHSRGPWWRYLGLGSQPANLRPA